MDKPFVAESVSISNAIRNIAALVVPFVPVHSKIASVDNAAVPMDGSSVRWAIASLASIHKQITRIAASVIGVARQVRPANKGVASAPQARSLVERRALLNAADVQRVLMRGVPSAKKARVCALRDKIAALW